MPVTQQSHVICSGKFLSILLNFLQALRDLADPAEGVYNATALLETRLSYVCNMLDKYQKLPSNRPMQSSGPSASLAVTAPEEISGSTLLSSVVTAIKNVASGEENEVVEEKRQVDVITHFNNFDACMLLFSVQY